MDRRAEIPWIPWSTLQVSELLGDGCYARVVAGTWKETKVAIKDLHLKVLPKHLFEEFNQDAEVHCFCQCAQIVRLFGVSIDVDHFALVLEFMPTGPLSAFLRDKTQQIPWDLRYSIAADICAGLLYLHSKNITHKNLKSSNVLLGEQFNAKLTDFGFNAIKSESASAGSIRWLAPEAFKRDFVPTPRSDIYSLGVLFWELASRTLPFANATNDIVVMGWLKDGETETIPEECPTAFADMIKSCWAKPDKRPTVQDLSLQIRTFTLYRSQSAANGEDDFLDGMALIHSGKIGDGTKCFEKAASKEYPPAYILLYRLYEGGLGACLKDPTRSQLFKEKASEFFDYFEYEAQKTQSPIDYFHLAYCHDFALGTPADEEFAARLYRLAGEKGYAPAQLNLGICYMIGSGVPKDTQKALTWFQLASDQGYSAGHSSVGEYYLNDPVHRDEAKSFQYFRMSAEQGYPSGQFNLAIWYDKNHRKDEAMAAHYYQLAAAQGHMESRFNLGVSYEHGFGVKRDLARAAEFYLLAADQGYTESQFNVANCFMSGKGVPKNKTLAVEYYKRAALQGHVRAMFRLGRCYEEGNGVKIDRDIAFKYFSLAAEQGDGEAQHSCGLCFYKGLGTAQDKKQAFKLFQLSANQNFESAHYQLGRCYEEGEAVMRDEKMAYKHYGIASQKGYPGAARAITKMDNNEPQLH